VEEWNGIWNQEWDICHKWNEIYFISFTVADQDASWPLSRIHDVDGSYESWHGSLNTTGVHKSYNALWMGPQCRSRYTIASSPFCDDPIFYDQISAQEENLVHSFVPAENPEHHRWLFPTTEIMEHFCNHWYGEWTPGCNLIFHNIARALDRGTAKPLTHKGWKAYLHSTNHGDRCPETVLTQDHFSGMEDILQCFPDVWHRQLTLTMQKECPIIFWAKLGL